MQFEVGSQQSKLSNMQYNQFPIKKSSVHASRTKFCKNLLNGSGVSACVQAASIMTLWTLTELTKGDEFWNQFIHTYAIRKFGSF